MPERTRDLAVVPTAALTVQAPWSHAIAHLGKNIENRVWRPGFAIARLLIHAGAKADRHSGDFFTSLGLLLPVEPVLSAIVAVTSLTGVCSAAVDRPATVCGCGRWAADNQHHWRLGPVRALEVPVPCRGRLGLWLPDEGVIDAVLKQVP